LICRIRAIGFLPPHNLQKGDRLANKLNFSWLEIVFELIDAINECCRPTAGALVALSAKPSKN
jgi:hypothetical protein